MSLSKKNWSYMKVTPIRPDIKDPKTPLEGFTGDLIMITIEEGQVEVASSLIDEKTLFYIDLCKHIIMRDTLDGYDDYD
jgi:hypothetical protein